MKQDFSLSTFIVQIAPDCPGRILSGSKPCIQLCLVLCDDLIHACIFQSTDKLRDHLFRINRTALESRRILTDHGRDSGKCSGNANGGLRWPVLRSLVAAMRS